MRPRGYRVMAVTRLADAHADLEHIFRADPHYVAMEVADLASPAAGAGQLQRARATVKMLRGRGIQVVARRIETEEQA